jgi:hypothetical protein
MIGDICDKKYFWHKSIFHTLNGSKFPLKCFVKKEGPVSGATKTTAMRRFYDWNK